MGLVFLGSNLSVVGKKNDPHKKTLIYLAVYALKLVYP